MAAERHAVDRMKKEFLSTVSHELRTPLTSIRSALGLLDAGLLGTLEAEARDAVAIANRSAIRLIGLINDILDIERADSPSGLPLSPTAVDLDVVVRRAAESVAALSLKPAAHIDPQPSGLRVVADDARLEQVLINLLSNAVTFSPAHEAVSVRCRTAGAMVRVEVADRGPGVAASFRPALFEPFRQAEGADNRARGGSGLGLTISRTIIRQHGGEIGHDDHEGGGSIFWFTLPLAGEAHA